MIWRVAREMIWRAAKGTMWRIARGRIRRVARGTIWRDMLTVIIDKRKEKGICNSVK